MIFFKEKLDQMKFNKKKICSNTMIKFNYQRKETEHNYKHILTITDQKKKDYYINIDLL